MDAVTSSSSGDFVFSADEGSFADIGWMCWGVTSSTWVGGECNFVLSSTSSFVIGGKFAVDGLHCDWALFGIKYVKNYVLIDIMVLKS